MATFGYFFASLRGRAEQTGRTDYACEDMDCYQDKRRTEPVVPFGREDRGWKAVARKELSYSNLLEFSAEMTRAGIQRLVDRVNNSRFDPYFFGWELDAVHEFYHLMLETARECGLDVDSPSGWSKARSKSQQKSTRRRKAKS